MLVQNGSLQYQMERTRIHAERLLDEVRREVQRAAADGADILPRLRSVHEQPGHATPEFRTLVVPAPPGGPPLTPDVLSMLIARYARARRPDRLLLVLDALHDDGAGRSRPVLIAEARDRVGTRLFLMQPYHVEERSVRWDEPLAGGWRDPGDDELILDAAFQPPD